VAKTLGHTGIEVRSNDESALKDEGAIRTTPTVGLTNVPHPAAWSTLGPLNHNSPHLSASTTTITPAQEAPSLRCQLLWSVVTCGRSEVLKTGDRSRGPRVGSLWSPTLHHPHLPLRVRIPSPPLDERQWTREGPGKAPSMSRMPFDRILRITQTEVCRTGARGCGLVRGLVFGCPPRAESHRA